MLTLFPRPSRPPAKPPEPVAPAPEPGAEETPVAAEAVSETPIVERPADESPAESVVESQAAESPSAGSNAAEENIAAEAAPSEVLAPEPSTVSEADAEPVAEIDSVESAVAELRPGETPSVETIAADASEAEPVAAEVAAVESKADEIETLEVIVAETAPEEVAAEVQPGSPTIENSVEESPSPEESIAAELAPSDVLAVESPTAELPVVGETIADTVADSHSTEQAIPEGAEIEWEAAETDSPEAVAIKSDTVEPSEGEIPVAAEEEASALPEVEHSTEQVSAPEEFIETQEHIALDESAAAGEAILADQTGAETGAAETEQIAQPSGAPPLDPAIAVEDSAREISVPDAEVALAAEEVPALLSEDREEHASSSSGLLDLPRVAEPEVMDDAEEVEAYASAAAQAWLDKIDDSFIEHAAQLVKGRQRGRALDIGTGPGRIALKLALRLSLWKFIGVDRSQIMIEEALSNLAATAPATGRLEFHVADGNRLDYPDASFDLVVCNSVLHHFAEPQNLLTEIARVVKPRGAILLRDLCRPSRLKYPFHIRWHGRRYTGKMSKLYRDSVRAAYTVPELQRMLNASPLRGARVFRHGSTHIGLERPYNW